MRASAVSRDLTARPTCLNVLSENAMDAGWQFWIDRGGTFTDVVARAPDGTLQARKLLSENPEHYPDAALQGIRETLGIGTADPIPAERIASVKMGTTVATNALLERKGDRTVLVITTGLGDGLRIGYQNRPKLFVRHIELPEMLYERVIEANERVTADGTILTPLDEDAVTRDLQSAYDAGIRAAAIVLMHGYRYTDHERRIAAIARTIGFTQVSVSHEVSPLMKLVSRGDTTVVDAYLSPILRRYIDGLAAELGGTRLMFMQSNGGLSHADYFQGKDSILSGPAGGVVGAVRTSEQAGFDHIIGFDMGGTSTDVSHYDGEFERAFETEVAGVRMRAPMMAIHTVAAGGGSILHFDGSRYRVGPDSAGANPGPACYRRGGPLTVTDANVCVGKLQPDFFPNVFGPNADQPIDAAIVHDRFAALAKEIEEATGDKRKPEEVANGFIAIAVENMANAIKKISIQRGYDVTDYTLCCFGGAGAQHACLVADALGMTRVTIHPLASLLSAYGMGLADTTAMRERAVEATLDDALQQRLTDDIGTLEAAAAEELRNQNIPEARTDILRKAHLRYEGSDTPLIVDFATPAAMRAQFEDVHRQRYGFAAPDKPLIVEAVSVEARGRPEDSKAFLEGAVGPAGPLPDPRDAVTVHTAEGVAETPIYDRNALPADTAVNGPAIIAEPNSTIMVEPGWQAKINARAELVLTRVVAKERAHAIGTEVDPVMLEIFNNLFMSIAEQMGSTLQNTASSVNIKERLDFSCAVFDADGNLVANAPHMPVHLGSMSESIKTVIRERGDTIKQGDVYVLNAPYNGGTHLPDVTVITPVFDEGSGGLLFFTGSRGHQADIGGITPGSMPPDSTSIDQEGILIDNFLLVDGGRLRETEMLELLSSGDYPARNPAQNMADLKAQVAACEKGAQELRRMVAHFGLDVVQAYMGHVQDNAEESVRRVIDRLHDGSFVYPFDDGYEIRVAVRVDHKARGIAIDFAGTSSTHPGNYNAPRAVTMAAVLYVFRLLVDDDIPLNQGCLKPIDVIIPDGSMLDSTYPAAVVAGNVETSQNITDTLIGALEVMGAAQGTMNNFTFGNERWQYYETISGGSGAGPGFDGTAAVQVHMTNTRLTDPEVLEWRFPVLLESHRIRSGSGGRGKWRGGDGTIRRIRFLEPMTAAVLASHRVVPPFGMAGGDAGQCGRNWVERADGSVEESESGRWAVEMERGDVFVIQTPTGGGYGDADEQRAAAE